MRKLKSTLAASIMMIVSTWLLWAIGYHFMPAHPFAEWYGFPLQMTLVFLWALSCGLAAELKIILDKE